ncbi:MAG: RNA methyltransferase [Bacteroidales bacterium]|jgi:tRNA G18 (ribose-2'-O)-methylase SpoU|nr:RNA methyltransferase [Bacteroidales bacterium]
MHSEFQKLGSEELGRKSIEEYKESPKMPIVVVLDNVRSANNVGSVFRTSDAFLVAQVYLCGITATPPNKDIQKTALGAQLSVPWAYAQSTVVQVRELKQQGYRIIAVEQAQGSIFLQHFKLQAEEKIALVMGNEVFGVSHEVMAECDACIEIPQFGTKHSFNVAVTFGMVMWEICKTAPLFQK